MSQSFISELRLANFRNFSDKKIEFVPGINFLVGKNGVGKTNVLEALTLTGRLGQSLRGSALDEMILSDEKGEKKQQFVIHSAISDHDFLDKIALSFDVSEKKKNLYVNGEMVSTRRQSDVNAQLFNFIFITPQIEQLFISGKSSRREYLDRIVSDLDLTHQTNLNKYQKLLRERLAILQKYGVSPSKDGAKWLDIVENNIAENGVVIASARIEAVDFFNKAITSFASDFPKSELRVIGEIEEMLQDKSAMQCEEFYRTKLAQNRQQDCESFRTDFGVHRSDFDAIFSVKNVSALRSSTGEQKAIMLGITMARARISSSYKNQATALILDEVMSHLDEGRKEMLLREINDLGLQTFCSVTNMDLVPENETEKCQAESCRSISLEQRR